MNVGIDSRDVQRPHVRLYHLITKPINTVISQSKLRQSLPTPPSPFRQTQHHTPHTRRPSTPGSCGSLLTLMLPPLVVAQGLHACERLLTEAACQRHRANVRRAEVLLQQLERCGLATEGRARPVSGGFRYGRVVRSWSVAVSG